MSDELYVIKIADFLSDQSRILVGFKKGNELRKKTQIDKVDQRVGKIKLIIPPGIWAMSHTYWEGFLCNVIKRHGKEKFMEKYEIVSSPDRDFSRELIEAVDIILRG